MNKSGRYISAFTLVDVMSGMVIISIVMSMTFFLMSSVNKQTHDFQQLKLKVNQLVLIQNDLKRQIELSEQLTEIPHGFEVQLDQQELTYVQEGELLIRRMNLEVDTLHENMISLQTKTCNTQTNQVNEVSLNLDLDGFELNLRFMKEYGAAHTINNMLLNGD